MKRILSKTVITVLVTVFTVLSLPVFAQMTVDQVHDDSTALAFVKQQNYAKATAPQWKFFYLTAGDEWKSYYNFSKEETDRITQDINALRWDKSDINGDKKADLIVSGYIARRPGDWSTATFKVLVFLSQSGKAFQEYDLLTDNSEKYPAYFDRIRLKDKDYIRLFRWQLPDHPGQQPYQVDTLAYQTYWSNFINVHNQPVNPESIQKLVYKAQDDPQGSYHGLEIDDAGDKRAGLVVTTWQTGDKVPATYKARLTKDLWQQLDTLCRGIHLEKIADKNTMGAGSDSIVLNHQVNSQDLPVSLTLYFRDGKHLKIVDYGSEGSFTLMTIYGCLERIIQNVFDQMQQRQQIIESLSGGLFNDY